MNKPKSIKMAFWGTSTFAVTILEELEKAGLKPSLVVTAPDMPRGRGLVLTPPPVKVWAEKNQIKVLQPTSLSEISDAEIPDTELASQAWDIFIVAAYGKIIPENILNLPKFKTLNVHPSLLPKYRGPSPIESAILNDDREAGVSIMRLDKEIDHGPILAQEKIPSEKITLWPMPAPELENIAAHFGGALLAKTISDLIAGKIVEKEQDHTRTTYCKKIVKADGLIDLSADSYTNYLKICAYTGWPGTYFFQEHGSKKIRVSIKKATYQDGKLTIQTVVPEGKSEMPYLDFLRGIK